MAVKIARQKIFLVSDNISTWEIKDKIKQDKAKRIILSFSIFTIVLRVIHYLVYPRLIQIYKSYNLPETQLMDLSFYVILFVVIGIVFIAVISVNTQEQKYLSERVGNGKLRIIYSQDNTMFLLFYLIMFLLVIFQVFLYIGPFFILIR